MPFALVGILYSVDSWFGENPRERGEHSLGGYLGERFAKFRSFGKDRKLK